MLYSMRQTSLHVILAFMLTSGALALQQPRRTSSTSAQTPAPMATQQRSAQTQSLSSQPAPRQSQPSQLQPPQSQPPQSQSSASSSSVAVLAPDPARLRTHVTFLASDKLEGRKTGTPAAEEAATYIARELASYGVKVAPPTPSGYMPGMSDAGYLRGFPYVASVELGKGNAFIFASRAVPVSGDAPPATLDLRLQEDWMPVGWSGNGRAENLPVTFVGYGISAPEFGYDDYAGTNLSGRIALAFAGVPDDNPHGRFVRFSETRLRAAAARERGARALVLIAREENLQDERLARLRYDNAGGDAGLPVVVISRTAARRMLEAGRIALPPGDLEKAIRALATGEGGAGVGTGGGVLGAGGGVPTGAGAGHASSAGDASSAGHVSSALPQAQTLPQQTRRNFSAALENVTLSISVDLVRRRVRAFNVVGLLEGSDPKLKSEALVVGAHYDHLGRGGEGSLAAREGDIHHGADDNASGVAAMLELARLFAAERPRRSIVFIAFGGEEEGLLGSSWYANNPVVPLAQTVAMINMDMVGRLKDERLLIGGVGTAEEWRGWIRAVNEELEMKLTTLRGGTPKGEMPVVYGANGRPVAAAAPRERFKLTLNEDGYGPSDHSSFYSKKIPVLFFFTGTHEDYHKPSDTAERINYEGEARVVAFVGELLRELDRSDKRPTYTVARSENAGRSTGFRVYLGTVPNYAESDTGMKLDAVRDDSPASRAGLRAGDVIVKIAGRDVRNVYDYTNALSEMQPGREYEVEVVRDGKRLQIRITPAGRK